MQQSPFFDVTSAWHCGHFQYQMHAFVGIVSCCWTPQCGQRIWVWSVTSVAIGLSGFLQREVIQPVFLYQYRQVALYVEVQLTQLFKGVTLKDRTQ